MSIIEVNNLVKKYGDNVAVNDLSLTIDKSGVYGFLGPNGAGKSTTMNILTGYIGATAGEVKICGFDIFKEPEEAKKNIGYLPEIPPLYQDMTVMEYLDFVANLKMLPKKKQEEYIKEAVEMAKITEIKGRLIKNLSKGYKQRVGIAQAILGMPPVIILDEPTVGLDPKQIIEIRDLIRKLGKEHTVILSSHILTEISEVCEKIFIISQGKLVAEGTEKELVEQMAGKNILDLTIKGEREAIEDVIAKMNVEAEVTFSTLDENMQEVRVVTDRVNDIREDVFYKMAEEKLPILTMNFKTKTLEDIFIEMTTEYKAPVKNQKQRRREKNNASNI